MLAAAAIQTTQIFHVYGEPQKVKFSTTQKHSKMKLCKLS